MLIKPLLFGLLFMWICLTRQSQCIFLPDSKYVYCRLGYGFPSFAADEACIARMICGPFACDWSLFYTTSDIDDFTDLLLRRLRSLAMT